MPVLFIKAKFKLIIIGRNFVCNIGSCRFEHTALIPMRNAKKHIYDHAKSYLTLDGISTKLTDLWEIEVDETIVNGTL